MIKTNISARILIERTLTNYKRKNYDNIDLIFGLKITFVSDTRTMKRLKEILKQLDGAIIAKRNTESYHEF